MRKLCPNLEREDALDTVLEVPLPEEMFPGSEKGGGKGGSSSSTSQEDHYAWLKSQPFDKATDSAPQQKLSGRTAELELLLRVLGSPLIPVPVPFDTAFNSRSVRESSIQASTAKYILQQYIAATGGQAALLSVQSMYAVGKVRMSSSEFHMGNDNSAAIPPSTTKNGAGEIGGFVLWQKSPQLWFFELIMAGCKLSAGCNGQIAWRQSAAERSQACRGPPRPLRRTLQGVDPRSTANLFADAVCIGEKIINREECFILKLEANAHVLKSRSSSNFYIIRHTIWGYFSQRTGLLMQLEDSQLLRMKADRSASAQISSRNNNNNNNDSSIFWETSMESIVDNYRYIDGINIAHSGRTVDTRYGEGSVNHRRRMEEIWTIEEADFNLHGLAMDHFLPPSDLKVDCN
ncbi:uncharacterized protein LOC110032757 [Phalaenopsis equestris]|uniref:uncharacterized protein LOC110032757 n=1 Tax=Phalaenopsis equestris TaxID=78828 RepID=UPI0009E2B94D|nr:uncharacterized protein LOC110032757 [Phalaenopsis equestris]